MTDTAHQLYPVLSPIDRFRAMFATVSCGAALLVLAPQFILTPADPEGSVSALVGRHGWLMIPTCAAAAFILGAAVCAIARAKLEELGTFAVCVGLALATLYYHNASHLWLALGRGDDSLRAALGWNMAIESLAWMSVPLAAAAGNDMAIRMFGLRPTDWVPMKSEWQRGLLTILAMTAVATILLPLLQRGSQLSTIQTGQVCFAVAFSFYLAAMAGYQLTAARSPLWLYAAVALTAIIGYAWTATHPTPTYGGRDISHLAQMSPTGFGRALPLQMIAIGTAGAIFGNWHQRQITRFAMIEEARMKKHKQRAAEQG